MLPWDEPDWLERAAAWVSIELERLAIEPAGPLELVRTRPWAAVAKQATRDGDVWFKEPAPASRFEPALSALVYRVDPAETGEVLAFSERWLLTRDAGPLLRELLEAGRAAPTWEELLPRYAALQLELVAHTEDALALETPDRRPEALPALYDELVAGVQGLEELGLERHHLEALAPALELVVEALAGPLPLTLAHEEFHEHNVFVRAGQARLLDWGEACVAHPFCGVTNTFRDICYRHELAAGSAELLRLRDLYLEPFSEFAPLPELRQTFSNGYLLGTLCRALTWARIFPDASAADRAEYQRNAVVWLDLFREGLEDGVKLGA
jgi:hypothetical protein